MRAVMGEHHTDHARPPYLRGIESAGTVDEFGLDAETPHAVGDPSSGERFGLICRAPTVVAKECG